MSKEKDKLKDENNKPENEELEQGNDNLLEEKERLEISLTKAEDQVLRVTAEFQNFKKRIEKEKIELIKYSNENLITDLLTVLDNFDRAIASLEQGSVKEGVIMIRTSFFTVLGKYGLVKIDALGKEFNHNEHHAVVTEETGDEPDIVLAVLQEGYKIGDKVIRPAMVKVSK